VRSLNDFDSAFAAATREGVHAYYGTTANSSMLIVQEPLERRRQLLAEAMKGKADPIALSESLNANVSELSNAFS
jgi:hypothetical protein